MILGDCAPLGGELLPDCYSYQKLLRVSFTVRKLMAWVRSRRRAIPDLPFERPVSMEKQR